MGNKYNQYIGLDPGKKCLCGCGAIVRHKFLPGHNLRIKNPVDSLEVRKKISDSLLGKLCGEKNPFYGKHHTIKNKKHWSKIKLGKDGPFYGKTHTLENRLKFSQQKKDEKNPRFYKIGSLSPSWKGGERIYGPRWGKRLKKIIKERDNYICQSKKCDKIPKRLDVHHKDFNKQNNNEDNLITLCRSCHLKIHKGYNKENG